MLPALDLCLAVEVTKRANDGTATHEAAQEAHMECMKAHHAEVVR